MNAKELETQHNLKKWAAIIKECHSSGMKILQWIEINKQHIKRPVLLLAEETQRNMY